MAQIFDAARTFAGLKKTIIEGVSSTFPIETNNRLLKVSNVEIDDSKADPVTINFKKRSRYGKVIMLRLYMGT